MKRRALLAGGAAAAMVLAACGDGGGDGGGGDGGEGGTLTMWTVEDLSERVEAQQAILDRFAEETGTRVELVPVAEDQLTPVLTSAAAAGDLPDVIAAVSLGAVNQLNADGLLDTALAAEIVDALGEDTFSESALELTRSEDTQLAVPSDSWSQLLFYRTDLFEQAGLEPPESYEAIEAAAQALNTGGVAGIVAATAPAETFTHQTFEQVALANDCQLVDDGGDVALESEQCTEAVTFYTDLMRNYSVAGNQDADTTRAAYFAGTAGMVIWSSFLLDELAGLRNDALPTCPECADNPRFLSENTGVVSAIEGPSGSQPATFGEVVSFAPLADAAPETADLVQWLMEDGYEDWLAIAPEGKVPVRTGTADEPDRFTTAWRGMQAGVDTKAPLSDIYDPAVLEAVAASAENLTRWGIPQGQGQLAGTVQSQFVIPAGLAEVINAGTDPADAVASMAEQVTQIQQQTGS
ncbi:ABC transporter substrate-binding protein [Georgenia sp. AZ-5]|uniref:ABC transporter substrate-binding protein n=1 Tax=Georgenia sp. AZ-5 TaxID=3367526 RepID=UPI0037552FD1